MMEEVGVTCGSADSSLSNSSLHWVMQDELYIPAGVPHSTKNIAATNTTWLYG
jgi:hypothetical protein